MRKILITGAAGYLGSLLHRRLTEQFAARESSGKMAGFKARRVFRKMLIFTV